MPDKPVTIKGAGGSFMSAEKLRDQIQAKRAEEEVTQAKAPSEATPEDSKIAEEVDKMLPREVPTSYGRMSYAAFKALYSAVWDQVRDKDHLAVGYCSHEGEAMPGVMVKMRTLKAKENRAMLKWTPSVDITGAVVDPGVEAVYRNVRLAVALMHFNGDDLPALPALTPEVADKWMGEPVVKQTIEWLDNLPEEVVFQLAGVMADITNAMRFALRENLKNRLAPPSLS